MRKIRKYFGMILLIGTVPLFFILCSQPKNIITSPEGEKIIPGPGKIVLTHLKGIEKKAESKMDSTGEDSVRFNLGDIKASRDFYFLIRNVGGSAIRDISIQSTNPLFKVTPNEIELLEPDSIGAIIPILRVSAIHGKALDGVGLTELMPMGTNSTFLNISGTTSTIDNSDTMVSHTAQIIVNALIMDIELLADHSIIDLTKPDGTISSNLGGLGFIRRYEYLRYGLVPKIFNSGNVPINISIYCRAESGYIKFPLGTINPGDTLIVDFPENYQLPSWESNYNKGMIEIDGGNTITYDDRLQLGNNGKAYFSLDNFINIIIPGLPD